MLVELSIALLLALVVVSPWVAVYVNGRDFSR